jgi:hypothetical protein
MRPFDKLMAHRERNQIAQNIQAKDTLNNGHARAGEHPEGFEIPGFPLARERRLRGYPEYP